MKINDELIRYSGLIAFTLSLFYFVYKYSSFVWYIFVLLLPGFFLTYNFSKKWSMPFRIIIAYPLSSLLLILINILSNLGVRLNVGMMFFLVIILPIIVTIIFQYKDLIPKTKYFLNNLGKISKKNGKTLLSISLIMILTLFFWNPLLQDQKLPLTDQVVNQQFTYEIIDELENVGKVPNWQFDLSGGINHLEFDSILYYMRFGILYLFNFEKSNMTHAQNALSFFSAFIFLLGLYILGRKFGFKHYQSLLIPVLFTTNPLIGSKYFYSGDMKELFAMSVLPALVICFSYLAEKKDFKWAILTGLLLAYSYHAHLITFVMNIIILGLYYLFILLNKKLDFKKEIKLWIIIAIVLLPLILFHLYPFVSNLEYTMSSKWNSNVTLDGFYNVYLKEIYSNPLPDRFTIRLGLYFSILALLGLVLYNIAKYRNWREIFSDKINLLLFSFLIMLTFYFIPGMGTTFGSIRFDRIMPMTLVLFCIFTVLPLSIKHKSLRIAIIITILLVVIFQFQITKNQMNKWTNERAQNGMFSEYYNALYNEMGQGRLITYGVFSYAVETIIPKLSDGKIWMITHTTPVGARTLIQDEVKATSNEQMPYLDYGMQFLVNRFRTSYTKYVLVYKCANWDGNGVQNTFDAFIDSGGNLVKIHEDQCVSLYLVPYSGYAEEIPIYKSDLERHEILEQKEGWKIIRFLDDNHNHEEKNEYPEFEITNVNQIVNLTEPIPHEYEVVNRDTLKVIGPFEGGWVHIKNHYYPKWHAYQDGKQLKIRESEYGTILVDSNKGGDITLSYKLTGFEYFLNISALLWIILLLALPYKYNETAKE